MCKEFIDLANSKINSYASRVTNYDDDFVSDTDFVAICRQLAYSGTLEKADIREMWKDNRGILYICWDVKTIWGNYATYKYHGSMWHPWNE